MKKVPIMGTNYSTSSIQPIRRGPGRLLPCIAIRKKMVSNLNTIFLAWTSAQVGQKLPDP